jgi:hypothetical protein
LPFAANTEDFSHDGFGLRQHLPIVEPEHKLPVTRKTRIPLGISVDMIWFIMLAAIQFDNEPGSGGIEVHDVRPERLLPVELDAENLLSSQM